MEWQTICFMHEVLVSKILSKQKVNRIPYYNSTNCRSECQRAHVEPNTKFFEIVQHYTVVILTGSTLALESEFTDRGMLSSGT